jgi:hypothetical protein
MFWYEFYLRGIGNAELCYERLEDILPVALEQLLTCDCEDGCPNCTSRLITPYHVRNIELGEGQLESRRAAVVVLNSLLKGCSARDSLSLLDAAREKRGMMHLPTVTGEGRRARAVQMPLDQRTRSLMLRKLERSRLPKLPLDHEIDPSPQVGTPARESADTVGASDPEMRTATTAIHVRGDPLARKLRQRLSGSTAPKKKAEAPPAKAVQTAQQAPAQPKPAGDEPLLSGDPIARKARRLRRRSTES